MTFVPHYPHFIEQLIQLVVEDRGSERLGGFGGSSRLGVFAQECIELRGRNTKAKAVPTSVLALFINIKKS